MKNIFTSFALPILLLTLYSCSSQPYITARTYPYGRKNLASYHVDTPDPLKATLSSTQKIEINWKLPGSYSLQHTAEEFHIDLVIRFKDGSHIEATLPTSSFFGKTFFEIPPAEHTTRGAITSYKISLCHGTTIVATTKHKLWEEKIIIIE